MVIIDPPVSEFSSVLEIQLWIEKIRTMDLNDLSVKEAYIDALRMLDYARQASA